MKDTKSYYYMLMKLIAHGHNDLWIFMEFSSLNNLLYFISLIAVRHLPCIIEGIGHSPKNNYTSGKQEGSVGSMGRDKEIMNLLKITYF